MTTPDQSQRQAITPEHIAALFQGHELRVTGHPYEVTITNPRDPERGTMHIANDDAYVSWEPITWHHWGILEGHQHPGSDETTIPIAKIIQTLTEPPSPFPANPSGI